MWNFILKMAKNSPKISFLFWKPGPQLGKPGSNIGKSGSPFRSLAITLWISDDGLRSKMTILPTYGEAYDMP